MAGDPDEVNDQIWKADYRGPEPLSQPIRLSGPTEPGPAGGSFRERPPPGSSSGRRCTRRTGVSAVAVVALSIAGVVVVVVGGSGDKSADSASATSVPVDQLTGAQPAERYELPDIVATSGVPFPGADPRRLPDTLDPIWSRRVSAAATDDVWVEVTDRRFALMAVGPDRASASASSVLWSLDAETGVTRWSTDLAVPPVGGVRVDER